MGTCLLFPTPTGPGCRLDLLPLEVVTLRVVYGRIKLECSGLDHFMPTENANTLVICISL